MDVPEMYTVLVSAWMMVEDATLKHGSRTYLPSGKGVVVEAFGSYSPCVAPEWKKIVSSLKFAAVSDSVNYLKVYRVEGRR